MLCGAEALTASKLLISLAQGNKPDRDFSTLRNRSRLATLLAVSVTTNLALADLPSNVAVPALAAGLSQDSVINITQVIPVDRSFLDSRIGQLPAELLRRVEDGLRLIQGF
ncbi:type II toxin-antitoxin system PemK/MazF family toxin [Deinococcus detaillensis]|uniref:Type II toxin-antitoxin system PemK/MazF family toxin n=1 Tax=Deinococcus detaillensis TaxID=2592048 RepID=A0A553V497_9DEIO|nr:type II toxin-antitoxin system PemK/MazF family toxin [Deinococcus detaillensis]TSA87279.1 type II toxin-antitoxin system PemK/MazF family toxin [Deinococcus detaillensis]